MLGYAVDQTYENGDPLLVTLFSAPDYPQGPKHCNNDGAVMHIRFKREKIPIPRQEGPKYPLHYYLKKLPSMPQLHHAMRHPVQPTTSITNPNLSRNLTELDAANANDDENKQSSVASHSLTPSTSVSEPLHTSASASSLPVSVPPPISASTLGPLLSRHNSDNEEDDEPDPMNGVEEDERKYDIHQANFLATVMRHGPRSSFIHSFSTDHHTIRLLRRRSESCVSLEDAREAMYRSLRPDAPVGEHHLSMDSVRESSWRTARQAAHTKVKLCHSFLRFPPAPHPIVRTGPQDNLDEFGDITDREN